MKRPFLVLGFSAFLFASCETGEVTTSSEFDPLATPGSNRTAVAKHAGYKPGEFVHTSMDNVAFFKKRPSGDAEAEKTLAGNTQVKVINDDGNYVKGELDSGEVGYILSVQLTNLKGGATPVGTGNEFQIYPPPPGSVPPVIDPNLPTIPPVIDPNATTPTPAPVDPNAVPPVESPIPVVPPASTPLPPGVGE